MRQVTIVNVGLFALMFAGGLIAPACTPEPVAGRKDGGGGGGDDDDDTTDTKDATPKPAGSSETGIPDGPLPPDAAPRAVPVAGTTEIPACSSKVDAAGGADFTTIGEAVAAAKNGEIICVAEGTYSGEQLKPGLKYFTIAGGFQSGKDFKVRASQTYVTKVKGNGTGSFYRSSDDDSPKEGQLLAFDGLEISNYAQAIYRQTYFLGRVEITNSHFHDNDCNNPQAMGGAVSLSNIKGGVIKGNVFTKNTCGRGGAVALDQTLNKNELTFSNNLVTNNAGVEPSYSHGGAVYLFGNKLTITANVFLDNEVTGWGGGLFLGAVHGGGQFTTANLSWNVYRNNKAGTTGGGMFCDDAATCIGEHEIYDGNCGCNLSVDGGSIGDGGTVGKFSYMTNVNAKTAGCGAPGVGFLLDHGNDAPDNYEIKNSIFSGNASGKDILVACASGSNCPGVKVNVTYSMIQKDYEDQPGTDGSISVLFGAGIVAPADPLFVNAAKVDFHLKSAKGHWTPTGYVNDATSSPALAKGTGTADKNPAKAGTKPELGAYGNSGEASYTQ